MMLLLCSAHFCVLFNAVFSNFGINYLYLLPLFLSICIPLINGIIIDRSLNFTPVFLYLVILFVLAIAHIIIYQNGFEAIISLGLYSLPMFVWTIFFCKYTLEDYLNIFTVTYPISVCVATLGIVQYFYSPDLYGFIPLTSKSIEWAADDDFSVYSSFFRSTSTLGSPQVFGLFCAFYVIFSNLYSSQLPKFLCIFGGLIFFFAGALSGNKLFFAIIFLYFFFVYFVHSPRLFYSKFLVLFSIVVIFLSAKDIVENLPMLERVFDVNAYVQQEKSDSRIDKYYYILSNTNVFLGNGLGSITNKSASNLTAAESYILKLYYEGGVFLVTSFLILCFFIAASVRNMKEFYFFIMIFFSFVVVHAFESPSFFIVWGFLFSILCVKTPNFRNKRYANE